MLSRIGSGMFQAKSQDNLLAASLIVAAAAFIAAATLIAKLLSTETFGEPLHPLQISHGRFLFAFIAIATARAVLRPTFVETHWFLHLGRTICGWAGISLMFAAVAFIPMADATAISFLNPVFAMVLAIPLLGEKVGPIRWFAAAVALGGALILLRPTPESFQPAALLAFSAALVMGMEVTLIKSLARQESPFQILFYNNLIGVCIASIAVIPFWTAPTVGQWVLLGSIGLAMACAQAFFVNGMARADASFDAPFSYGTLIFAAIFDAFVFGVIPDQISVLGCVIILAGAVTLAIREHRAKSPQPKEH